MRVTSLSIASTLGALACFQTAVVVVASSPGSSTLQNILDNTHNGPEYQYPTDFTRDIIPVGHDKSSLTETRTLKSLYISQLLEILKRQNPRNNFVPSATRNGVFDTNPVQTLYLFIDIKTDGVETWKYVSQELQPLRDLGYLTKVQDGNSIPGPITVIGTGNTPLSLIAGLENRDYFYDAPLADLGKSQFQNITSLISPIASTSFDEAVGAVNSDKEDPLTSAQLETLRGQIKTAKSKGIGARYWETPGWPIRKRNEIWRVLLKEGVALLNVDDLDAVGEFF
ncbi:Altered inheritance of mitochondria protein 6 [Emydomyces testavorans]|uniref:Altered inheritance of mitochondria protein 6 n=1 Tax=Emydomyces testavorans TaxID=2070801 RepID=A0AAF0DCZ0_9EURO|nr:Altered inheritance of mitochondria protein 6 [Emydomyces testavorans]